MRSALILGASGDIGTACAKRLASEGWSLYLHFNQNEEKITKLISKLEHKYQQQQFFKLQLDMSKEVDLDPFIQQLYEVDAVIIASGQTVYKLLTETSSVEMDELWQSHLKVPVLLCQQLQEKLSRKNIGRIVFISSIYGTSGSSMEVMYSAIKGAQNAFVKAYAQEVATLGITVNAIAPGAVKTKMNDEWTKEEIDWLLDEIPLQRMAEPVEVAATVSFLLQEEASYITGTVIPITGGWKS